MFSFCFKITMQKIDGFFLFLSNRCVVENVVANRLVFLKIHKPLLKSLSYPNTHQQRFSE